MSEPVPLLDEPPVDPDEPPLDPEPVDSDAPPLWLPPDEPVPAPADEPPLPPDDDDPSAPDGLSGASSVIVSSPVTLPPSLDVAPLSSPSLRPAVPPVVEPSPAARSEFVPSPPVSVGVEGPSFAPEDASPSLPVGPADPFSSLPAGVPGASVGASSSVGGVLPGRRKLLRAATDGAVVCDVTSLSVG